MILVFSDLATFDKQRSPNCDLISLYISSLTLSNSGLIQLSVANQIGQKMWFQCDWQWISTGRGGEISRWVWCRWQGSVRVKWQRVLPDVHQCWQTVLHRQVRGNWPQAALLSWQMERGHCVQVRNVSCQHCPVLRRSRWSPRSLGLWGWNGLLHRNQQERRGCWSSI